MDGSEISLENIPDCYSTDGILGGANSYNYISLVIALLTLIVNVSTYYVLTAIKSSNEN